jgi:2-dehydro-3-deoxyphosphogluconate aldolase / (4S)-4-hydroxy-2-oxoglutarate aldolase
VTSPHASFERAVEPKTPLEFLERRVFAILRAPDAARLRPVVRTLFDAGLNAVELTMTTPRALDSLASVREEAPAGAWVGMGTVLDGAAAREAIAAGAQFLVSVVTDEDVVSTAVEAGVPVVPAATTPTEILRAWRLGASAVKVFPAATLGPDYFRHVLAPLPHVRLVATGGVGPDDVDAFLRAGASAVGMGTPLLGDALEGGDLDALAERCRQVLSSVGDATRR